MRWFQLFARERPVALVDRRRLRDLIIQTFLTRTKLGTRVICCVLFCTALSSAPQLKAQNKSPRAARAQAEAEAKYPELVAARKAFFSGDPKASLALLQEAYKKHPEIQPPQVILAGMFFDSGDPKSALASLREAVKKNPELRPPQVILSSMFFIVKKNAAGRAALDQAVREQPNNPDAFLVLGELALNEGRVTDATLLYDKAVLLTIAYGENKDKKTNYQIRCYAGKDAIARQWKDWNTSKSLLTRWLTIDPKNSTALFRLGQTLFQLGQPKEAYAKIQEAYILNKNMLHPGITMGQLYTDRFSERTEPEQKNLIEAAKWMEFAASKDPKNVKSLISVALWYWKNSQVEKSKAHAMAAAALNSESSSTKLLLGMIARYERDYPTALKHFEVVFKKAPDSFLAMNHLALTLIELNTEESRSGALKLAETLFKKNPNNPTALATLGWISFRTGKHEIAGNLLSAAAARATDNEISYYLARLLEASKRPQEAKNILRKALKDRRTFVYRKDAEDLLKRLEK